MYAVIQTGGKQYRITEGQKIRVEKLAVEAGSTYTFQDVLMLGEGESVKVGQPLLTNHGVEAEVLGHLRGDKIRIFKLKRRKNHRKQMGHRQWFTELKITKIA